LRPLPNGQPDPRPMPDRGPPLWRRPFAKLPFYKPMMQRKL
jgi:hypothetical protein